MMNTTFFKRYVITMEKDLLFLTVCMFTFLIPPHTVYANWTKTSGINAGSINALAVSGRNIFAGTGGGGVFLSTNNGTSWTAVNSGMPANSNIHSFAVRGSNIFAGTVGRGVFLSTNNGSNWTAVNNGLPANASVYSLAVNDSNIFAGTFAGGSVFLSIDNGTSWTAVNNGLPTNAVVYSLTMSGNKIFATANGRVFLSTNNGTNWTAVNNGLPVFAFAGRLAVIDSNIFAGTDGGGVFLSTNNGTTWRPVNNGLTDSTVWSLAVDRCLIFAGTRSKGVFFSADDGTTWKAISEGLTDTTNVWSLAVNDSFVFAGADGGSVWRRPLSEMVAVTNLTMQQEYVYPGDNYYDFSWNPVQGSVGYDFYCNNFLFLHVSPSLGSPLTYREPWGQFINIMESKTGKQLKGGDTLVFYLVARSFNNQVLGVSNFVRMPFQILVTAQPLKTFQKVNGIRITGTLIDCSSLKCPVKISLYSLNGAKVWANQGVGVKAIVPDHLPRGAYTVEVTGEFGKTSSVIIRE
jgi:photosystem II stability/assembly factor-like uncharacterized protein